MLPIIQSAPPGLDAELSAIAGLTSAADRVPVFTGSGTAALQTFTVASASWTPVLTFATAGDLSVAYSTQLGTYVRIGPVIFLWFNVVTSTFTHTTASGVLQMTGVPVAALTATGASWVGKMKWRGITKATYTEICAEIGTGSNTISFGASGSGVATSDVASTDVPTGGTVVLRGCITYPVA